MISQWYRLVFSGCRKITPMLQIVIFVSAVGTALFPSAPSLLIPANRLGASLQWLGGEAKVAKAAPNLQTVVTVGLRGTGAALLSPEIVVSSSSLNFGNVAVGDVLTRTLTISNTGTSSLLLTSLTLGGTNLLEFSALNGSCGGLLSITLAAGDSCTVNLTFHPSLLGSLTSTLSIISNDLDELLTIVNLSGVGIPVPAPEIVVSSSSLNFGDVELGDVLTRTLTISNTGNAPLLLTSLSLGGTNLLEFSAFNGSCGGLLSISLAAGDSCTVDLTFHPSLLGSLTSTLSIVSNDLDELLTLIGLSGNGIPVPTPELVISSNSLNFGDVELGDVLTRTLTISNTGNAPLLMTSLSLGGADVIEFSALNGSCGGLLAVSLSAGDSCTVNLTFHPSALGILTTTLSIVSNDLDALLTLIGLSGNGIPVPAPEIVISSPSVNFGDVELGDVLTRSLTISNTGNAPLLMTSISLGGADVIEFSALNGTCGLLSITLAAGDSCTIGLTFHPSVLGVLTTTLSIVSNDLDELLNLIDLSGIGIAIPAPEIEVSSTNLNFGTVNVGSVATQTITISNTGNAPLLISSIVLSGTDALEFTVIGGTCGILITTVAPGTSCSVQILFHPLTAGAKEAELVILNNDPSEPMLRIAFTGDGEPSAVALTLQLDTPIAGDNIVNRSEAPAVLFRGSTQPNAKVTLELDDGSTLPLKANTTADAAGNYEVTLNINRLTDGLIAVRALATDEANNQSTPVIKQIRKDTIVLAPVMVSPAKDEIVPTKAVVIRGTGEVGGVVTVLIAGQTLTSTVDATGGWQVVTGELSDKAYTPQLSITDAAGNQADFSDGHTFMVDTNRTVSEATGRIVYLPLIQK